MTFITFIWDALMHVWTNISHIWARLASSIDKNDFSLLSIALNAVPLFVIRTEVGITCFACTGLGNDLSFIITLIGHALLSITIWVSVVFTGMAFSIVLEEFSLHITNISNALNPIFIWVSLSRACVAMTIFQPNVSLFEVALDAFFSIIVWVLVVRAILAGTVSL